MKTKLFLLLTCIFCVSIYGQHYEFISHIITDTADSAECVFAADIDGDGDNDVLSASFNDNRVNWWENDGTGNFDEHVITTNAEGALCIFAADFNGDGAMDVLSASEMDDSIAWYDNVNGDGSVWVEFVLLENRDGARSVFAADFDGDGYMDVLSASKNDNTIAWYDNVDGNGMGWVENIITTNALAVRTIYAADIDGDGHMDVLSASENDGIIAWYENTDGFGTFGPSQVIITDPAGAYRVSAADFDGDGYEDVIAGLDIGKISWFKNDGQGTFGQEQIITEDAMRIDGIHPVDLYGDGHKDFLAAEYNNNLVSWYKNLDGLGNFSLKKEIESNAPGAISVYAADIDGDGDMDPLSAWESAGTIAWHETILGVDEYPLFDFSVYPIPTTGILNIQSKTAITQIEIHNLLGQLVKSNNNKNTIDISSVRQGCYFIKLKDENGNIGTQKVLKK